MGRPKATWDDKDIRTFKSMCGCFCTEDEICAVLGVSDKTLVNLINEYLYDDIAGEPKTAKSNPVSFKDAFHKYSAQGSSSIRRKQFELARAGDKTMLVWLGKQYLGQKDVVEHNVTEVPYIIDDVE